MIVGSASNNYLSCNSLLLRADACVWFRLSLLLGRLLYDDILHPIYRECVIDDVDCLLLCYRLCVNLHFKLSSPLQQVQN